MRQIYIEFNHAPYVVCLADNGLKTYYKKINIKGTCSVVSVEEKTSGNRKQAWIELDNDAEIEGIDAKEGQDVIMAIPDKANFYRDGADEKFKKHLAHYVGKPNLKFLEIGSYAGSSAVGVIEDILTDESSTVTCVDIWFSPFAEKAFDEITEDCANQIIKEVSYSKNWLETNTDKKFDFIYIDGDHSAEGVKSDMELSWKLLKIGGIMALDDYLHLHPRGKNHNPKPAIDAFIQSVKAEVLEISAQAWKKKVDV